MGGFRRRKFLIAAGGLITAPLARPQSASGKRHLGFLLNAPKPPPEMVKQFGLVQAARMAKLASYGWIEGKNLVVHELFSGGHLNRLPGLVKELVATPVDAIWVSSTAAAVAAARGTKTTPIVLAGATAYPVECGLIESYARPGTNVTGVAWFQSIEVHGKLAQFAREIVPSARRLAWMVFPADLITVSGGEFSPKLYYAKVAESLGFQFSYYECRKPEDIEPAFTALHQWGAQAVIVEPASLSFWGARRIADLALARRLPTFCGITQMVLDGGLLGYSPIHVELHVQAMAYVDRVFRGARPAEMPVEMPNKLELSINIGSAKALGLTIPPSVLLWADRVIE